MHVCNYFPTENPTEDGNANAEKMCVRSVWRYVLRHHCYCNTVVEQTQRTGFFHPILGQSNGSYLSVSKYHRSL
jgi:hypothetical protein